MGVFHRAFVAQPPRLIIESGGIVVLLNRINNDVMTGHSNGSFVKFAWTGDITSQAYMTYSSLLARQFAVDFMLNLSFSQAIFAATTIFEGAVYVRCHAT